MELFPAHAGVIPDLLCAGDVRRSFPRTRGGDPEDLKTAEKLIAFSPHTRG